jgi:hypothetical protein
MDSQQVPGSSIWRRIIDTQSAVSAWPATTTLLCFLLVLHILRNRRNHDDAPPPAAISRTTLVALSLGCVALDLILSHWVLFLVTSVYMFS